MLAEPFPSYAVQKGNTVDIDKLWASFWDPSLMIPLLASLLAGGLIGAEREMQGKAAGLRTHTLVCFASALMTLTALRMADWHADLPPGTQIVSDMSRMPHAILTGIGFLGAGVIFREGASVHGLTTAASLWLTAALGIVFGSGQLELAFLGTLVALVVLVLLRFGQRLFLSQQGLRIEIVTKTGAGFELTQLRSLLAQHGLTGGPPTLHFDREAATTRYVVLVTGRAAGVDCEGVAKDLWAQPAVQGLTLTPLGHEAIA